MNAFSRYAPEGGPSEGAASFAGARLARFAMVLGTSASPSLPEAPFLAAAEPRLGARGFRLAAFGFFGAFSASFPGSASSAAAPPGRVPEDTLLVAPRRHCARSGGRREPLLNAACARRRRKAVDATLAIGFLPQRQHRARSLRAVPVERVAAKHAEHGEVGLTPRRLLPRGVHGWPRVRLDHHLGGEPRGKLPTFLHRAVLFEKRVAKRVARRPGTSFVRDDRVVVRGRVAAAAAAASPSPSFPLLLGAGSAGARSAAGTAPVKSARSTHSLNARKPSIPGKAVTISSALTMPTPVTPSV